MATVDPFPGIKIVEDGERVTITYRKAYYGLVQLLAFTFAALFVSPIVGLLAYYATPIQRYSAGMYTPYSAAAMSNAITAFLVTVVLLGIVAPLATNILSRRLGGVFSFDRSKFYIGGSEYDRAHVSAIYVDGGPSAAVAQGQVVVGGGSGVTGLAMATGAAASQMSAAAGNAAWQAFEAVNRKVRIRYGEHRITLANGLDSKRAAAIHHEVVRRL